MLIPFLLFLITILLLSIFWELTKINSRIKKALSVSPEKAVVSAKAE
jgi:hypothetical protein